MTVFQINGGSAGSTGKIMFGIQQSAREANIDVVCAAPVVSTNRSAPKDLFLRIGSYWGRKASELAARISGSSGCFSVLATRRLLQEMDRKNADIIHLHTLHSSYINLPMLFHYIKKKNLPVVWTLHDCWAFTGHCPHFVSVDCDKWKTECHRCPLFRQYPMSLFDNSRKMHIRKKQWFSGITNMVVATPSHWLAGLVQESFLREYPVRVINNGIDLRVFRPESNQIREKLGCEKKYLILGVAFGWNENKGLDIFAALSEKLDEQYQIILVGTDEQVEKTLPKRIISIRRTQNQRELAQLYSAADVFVNPTREDTFPTVNMEALACGTPVITFRTGGSPEILDDTCGCVVECSDLNGLEQEIIRVCETQPYTLESCLRRAAQFDQNEKYRAYVHLYRSVYDGSSENRIRNLERNA